MTRTRRMRDGHARRLQPPEDEDARSDLGGVQFQGPELTRELLRQLLAGILLRIARLGYSL